jgi:ABC-type dipeptide/oligopeptide/nickel transport system permease subunit
VSALDTPANTEDIAARRGVHSFLPRLRAGTWAGIIILAIALAVAVFGPLIETHDPNDFSFNANALPSGENWLGTDDQGQDIYSRLIAGTRLSLGFGAAAALTALLLGGLLALIGLALGRIGDAVVFGFVDLVRALPGILFALALIVALEPGTLSVILALGVSFSPNFARITRATYFQEVARTYVDAARTFGAGRLRIALVHVLPNIAGALITQSAIILPRCIVSEAVLSFLGLGVSPELATWGRMIASASEYTEEAPHAVIIPIIFLSIVTFGLAMIGDELRRRYDPARRRMSE